MATEFNGYVPRNPGDLLTAGDWNDLQLKIREDIASQIKAAVEKINKVSLADNAHKLDNQTSDELAKAILEQARQELPKRTGYQRMFKRLKKDEEKVVKHNLGGCPLVDIYLLDSFEVVCSEDDQKNQERVYFYLYHSSERKIRFTPVGSTASPGPGVEIEPTGATPFRISFADMLAYYKVKYSDSSTLEDLETEFWQAFLGEPNDDFDDDQFCHSPWFDRCCGERRTVADLKSRGDWDELWFKIKPRKMINSQVLGTNWDAPQNIQVAHFDFNKLGITFMSNESLFPQPQFGRAAEAALRTGTTVEATDANRLAVTETGAESDMPRIFDQEFQNVMVLLKV